MSDPAAVAADGAVDPAAAARARALEIANRLSSKLGVPTPDAAAGAETSVLGKRARDEFPTGDGRAVGNRKKKVFVPTEKFPETNWFGIILGPRGTTLKQLEADTGARLFLRGKGASKEGEEEENEDLHVLIMAEEDATLERAGTLIEDYVHNPDKLKALQQQQLAQQAAATATPAAGEYAVAAANVTLPASLYSDDANANPSPFAAAGLGLGVPAAVHANTQELKIPHEKVGLVIGRSGETIKSIQAQTGCHIQIAKENECPGPDRTVSLSGDAHQIQLAKDEIMRIITETGRAAAITRGVAFVTPGLGHAAAAGHYGPGSGVYGAVGAVPPVMGIVSSQMNADGSSKTIHIPQIYVGLLIGKAGETIRNIQMKTGTMIQVSHVQKDETSDPAQSTRPVTLIGPPMACAAAEAEINTLIANSQLSGGAPPSVTGAVSGPSTSQVQRIPNAAVGVIIGRAGETIKRIQSVTGTRIQISKDEGKPERDVTITGTAHQIEHAKREIDTVIQGVELREMPPRVGAPRAAAGGFGAAGGYGAPAAAGGYGAAGYGGYGAPAGGYGAPGYGAPTHDPYGYGAPAHDPYGYGAGAHGAHAPYGGYGAAAQPAAAAAPAEAKPAANDQAEYERAYYAHQAAYYAQHGQYDSAPFVWPQK